MKKKERKWTLLDPHTYRFTYVLPSKAKVARVREKEKESKQIPAFASRGTMRVHGVCSGLCVVR